LKEINNQIIKERTIMAKRTASAVWEGTLKDGKGKVKLGSGAFEGQYSFASRFEEGTGTNPEELIGAAHAGCFSMALAAGLTKAGSNPKRISTTANVSLEKVGEGFKITTIELNTEGEVPGIEEKTFLEQAETAKKNCPVSQALAGAEIKLNAKLIKAASERA
jgi:lipoyl-dependent peroxiredoxin